jgi:hypothetical protein
MELDIMLQIFKKAYEIGSSDGREGIFLNLNNKTILSENFKSAFSGGNSLDEVVAVVLGEINYQAS